MKLLDDRDANNRRREAIGENVGTGSRGAEVLVNTEETRVTRGKIKRRRKSRDARTRRSCHANRQSLRVPPSKFGVSVGLKKRRRFSTIVIALKINGLNMPLVY